MVGSFLERLHLPDARWQERHLAALTLSAL